MKKIVILCMLAALLMPSVLFAEGQQDKGSAGAAEVKEEAVSSLEEAANAYFADYPGSRIIPTEKLLEKMKAGEDMLILDIRKPEDYAKGHLKGAVNVPFGKLASTLAWLPDDKPVYVNCYTGQTAGQAVAVLNVAGIQAVSIKYGWKLGISKTEGVDAYITDKASPAPEPSGTKYDPEVKAAVEAYFNAIPTGGINIWPAKKVKAALDNEEDIAIVSIRQPDAFAKGHIEGAVNIPFGADMQKHFADLPMKKTIVVYCYSGQTAGQTVGILRLLGFDAISLKSGMGTPVTVPSGWANEGFPVVK